MKTKPTAEELAEVVMDYYRARQAVDKFSPRLRTPEAGQALYGELMHCERAILYAGRLLSGGRRQKRGDL